MERRRLRSPPRTSSSRTRPLGKYRPEPTRRDLTEVASAASRALDAKTVRVVLRSRFSGWRTLFANVLPSHALRGEDLTKIWTDGIDNPKTGQRIGSGPFLLGSWERGRQLTLVRNPRYWGAHRAYLDRIVIRFRLEGENPVDWFRNGELDVADALNPDDVPRFVGTGCEGACRDPSAVSTSTSGSGSVPAAIPPFSETQEARPPRHRLRHRSRRARQRGPA